LEKNGVFGNLVPVPIAGITEIAENPTLQAVCEDEQIQGARTDITPKN
jgi:hypothetical protein